MKKSQPLHWQAYEYEPREQSGDWFWAVGIVTVGVAVTAIIFNNTLFAIVIILAGFSLSLYAARPPQIIDVVIDDIGVRIDKAFYPYLTLESFWVENQHGFPRILIKSQKLIMPYIVVPLDEEEHEPELVAKTLLRHLPEVFHSESVFEKILERLGF